MLITNATLSGNKPETEKITFYGYNNIKQDRTQSQKPLSLEVITDKVLAKELFSEKIQPIQPFMLSDGLTKDVAVQLFSHLSSQENYEGIQFNIIQEKEFHVIAYGKRSELKTLPNHFNKKTSNALTPINLVRNIAGFPFTQIKKPMHSKDYYVSRPLSREEFCQLPTYGFDTEFLFWWQHLELNALSSSNEAMITFLQEHGKVPLLKHIKIPREDLIAKVEEHFKEHHLDRALDYHMQPLSLQLSEIKKGVPKVHYFEHLTGQNKEVELDTVFGKAQVSLYKDTSANAMFHRFMNHIAKNPSIIYITVNGMKYDFKEMLKYSQAERTHERKEYGKATTKEFGIQGVKPIVDGQAGFFEKVVTHSCYHIDLSPLSQHFLPFSKDNKYVTVVPFFLGQKIAKRETYDQQIENALSELIDPASRKEDNLIYGIEDTMPLAIIKDTVLPVVYYLSKLFKASPETVCVTSKRSNALKTYEWKYLKAKKQSLKWTGDQRRAYDKFNASDCFHKSLDTQLTKRLNKEIKSDISPASLYYITPFTQLFSKELEGSEVIQEMFSFIESQKSYEHAKGNPEDICRFILTYGLEEGYLLPYIFSKANQQKGLSSIKGFDSYKEDMENFLSEYKPLNRSGNFYCFSEEDFSDASFQKKFKQFAIPITQGNLINVKKGSFILYDDTHIYKQGMDVKARSGFKTNYEKEFFLSMVDNIISDGPLDALKYFEQQCHDLKEGNLPKDLMYYVVPEVKKDYYNYSSYALRQRKFKEYMNAGVRKGDLLKQVLLPEDSLQHELFEEMNKQEVKNIVLNNENLSFMYDRLLGPQSNKLGCRNLQKGIVGQLVLPILTAYNIDPKEWSKKIDNSYEL